MRKLFPLLLLLPSLCFADRLGSLRSNADVLLTSQTATITAVSSGIAFGSPTNSVTQDTTTFRWDNTNKSLFLSGPGNLSQLYLDNTTIGPYTTSLGFTNTFGATPRMYFGYTNVNGTGISDGIVFLSSNTTEVGRIDRTGQGKFSGGITASSFTANGSGDGQIIETIFGSTYTVAASSVIPPVGNVAVFTSTWGTLGDGGVPGSGSGIPTVPFHSLQYNNLGAFGGATGLVYNGSVFTDQIATNFQNVANSSFTNVSSMSLQGVYVNLTQSSMTISSDGNDNVTPGILDIYLGNSGSGGGQPILTVGTNQNNNQFVVTDQLPVSMTKYGANIGSLQIGGTAPGTQNHMIFDNNSTQSNLNLWNGGEVDLLSANSGNGGKDIVFSPQQVEALRLSNTNGMIVSSSATFKGAGGVGITYNVNAGSTTGSGLSTCGDGTHALSWSAGQFGCQALTSGGGGSGSPVAITTGTYGVTYANPAASSPTLVFVADQSQFSALGVGTTGYFTMREVTSYTSGNFTLASTSTVVVANCSTACTVTLPTAVGIENKVYRVKIVGAGATSIATTSAQTIDGSTTVTPLPNTNAELNFKSDNANWNIF